MRCKKHITDLSSSVGICASCLRERLFVIIAAQAQAAQEDCRKLDLHPPPLVFPRSVSPYIGPRKSDDSAWNRRLNHSAFDQRFHSTPQIGPAGGEKQKSGFSLFSRLFRSKSKKADSDPSVSAQNYRDSSTASTSSPSWFSTMLSRHYRKRSQMASAEGSTAGFDRRTGRNRDRGVSPARVSDYGNNAELHDGSSGYSSESSSVWKQTPQRAAPPIRRAKSRPYQPRNVSGLTFCLSPLVRASPNPQWNQKGMPPETAFCGEIRAPVKPHLSTAASLCANRSRKLADLGRMNHNH